MSLKPIAIYGAGGFGKEVACVIERINLVTPAWEIIGFFDDGVEKGRSVSRFGEVLGGKEALNNWPSPLSVVFAIGTPKILRVITSKLANDNLEFPNIIHPEAYFADPSSFKIGKGNIVVRGCSFSCDVTIGDFNQFNSISALAHDVSVGSYNVFMPLTRISGEAQIGDINFFGINAIVLQGIRIGNRTRIGANSVVIRKTKDDNLYLGNPAKRTHL
jgi:sugar O-acyltransferase (sialic acid O-acetyltransferase NeuD family)